MGRSQAWAGPVWPSLWAHRGEERAVAAARRALAGGAGDQGLCPLARPWEGLWPHVSPSKHSRSLGGERRPCRHRGQGGKELAETVSRGI